MSSAKPKFTDPPKELGKKTLLLLLFASALYGEFKEAEGDHYTYAMAERHCQQLEGGEWRVPSIKELFFLRGQSDKFSRERAYWSANSVRDGKSQTGTGSEGDGGLQEGTEIGYTFYLQDGDVTLSPLNKRAGVICTNAVLSPKKSSYVKVVEGIKDLQNNIVWMPLAASDKKKKHTYAAAQTFCEENSYQGREWRLPSVDELYGIVDYAHIRPTVDTSVFGVIMNRYYWSDDEFDEDKAYVVGFKFGSVATSVKENNSYVRCVSDI